MIYVVLGTKAQLIKMAPVMRMLADRGLAYRFISTGQHRETMDDLLANFGIRPPDVRLYDGPDITSVRKMFGWAFAILLRTLVSKTRVFGDRPSGIVLVHGDTFSTLLGALMARLAGLEVGHVESGLRSFHIFHPFPEELTRLAVFRLASVCFCPGSWALSNLDGVRATKIDTVSNTLADAVRLATQARGDEGDDVEGDFCVASIHRFENIHKRAALERVVVLLESIAARKRVVFVMHPPTLRRLRAFGLIDRLESNPRFVLRKRSDFFSFIRLVNRADFVVSDGGSNQEECYYLGKPVLLLRMATERREGVGENCVVSAYDPAVVQGFADNWAAYRRPPAMPERSATEVIVDGCCQVTGAVRGVVAR